ncbi:MAG: DUF4878 domain-containing protein [Tidjanibacter sp.]|nr:DUF4878 domain-containing protein [Tidjanibacter sp.]
MKSFVVIVSAALLLASCSSSSPQKSVEECWHNLNRGHYKNAVELFLTTPDEEAVLRETFAEQGSKIKQAGGVADIEILSYDISTDSAKVSAAVTFGNSQKIEQEYSLVLKNKKWLIVW